MRLFKSTYGIVFVLAGALGSSALLSSCGTAEGTGTGSFAGPGSHYTIDLENNKTVVRKYESTSSTSPTFTVTGTVRNYLTGFGELTVETVTGTGGPAVGTTAYTLDIPGHADQAACERL